MNQSTEPREDVLAVSPPSWSREPRWAWMARAFPASTFARALGTVSLVIGTATSPRLSGGFDTAAQEKLSGYVTWTTLRPQRRPLTIAQARRLALSALADAEAARARFAEEEAARVFWWDDTTT